MKNRFGLVKSICLLSFILSLSLSNISFGQSPDSQKPPLENFSSPRPSNISTLEYEILMFERRTEKVIKGIERLLKRMNDVNSENIAFESDLSEKDSYIKDIEDRLFRSKSDYQVRSGELVDYQDDVYSLQAALNENETETRALLKDLEKYKEELSLSKARMEAELNEKDKEISFLKSKQSNSKEKVSDYIAKIRDLQTELLFKEKEYSSLQKQVNLQDQDLSLTVLKKNKTLESKDKELAGLKVMNTELAKKISQKQDIIKDLEDQLNLKEGSFSSLEKDLTSNHRKSLSKLSQKEKALKTLEAKNSSLSEKLTAQLKTISDLKKSVKNKNIKISSLESGLDSKASESSSSLARKNKLLSQKDIKLKSLADGQGRLIKELASKKAMIKTLESSLKSKEREFASLTREFNSGNDKNKISLAKKDKEIDSLTKKTSQLNSEIAAQSKTLKALEVSLKSKDRQVLALESEFNSGQKKTNSELSKKDKLLKDKDTQLKVLKDTESDLNKQLAQKLTEIEQLGNSLRTQDRKLASVESKVDLNQQQAANALAKKDTLLKVNKEEIVSLNNKIKDFQTKLKANNEANKVKDLSLANLNEKISKINQEKQVQASNLQAKLSELQLVKKHLNEEIVNQESQFTAEKSEIITQNSEKMANLRKTKNKLEKAFQSELSELNMKLELANEKIAVTVLADVLFNSGSNEIRSSRADLIKKIAKVLKQEAGDYQIIVEGHTDSEPIRYSKWKSNWHLSSARALSVLHFFIKEYNLDPNRLSASGFGEFKPVADNKSMSGRQKNRRVEIILLPKEIVKLRQQN
tara:strand:- start:1369 stop:3798 length:2430 start_codon:yes stop_codon:yes gene_type:complete